MSRITRLEEEDNPPTIIQCKRQRLEQKLAALLLGSCKNKIILQDEEGELLLDDRKAADNLTTYWGKVFEKKGTSSF